jgi:hypothetical protein
MSGQVPFKYGGKSTRESERKGVVRRERMKRGSGMKVREERSREWKPWGFTDLKNPLTTRVPHVHITYDCVVNLPHNRTCGVQSLRYIPLLKFDLNLE